MSALLFDRIARDAARLELNPRASYLRSYRAFLRYFAELPVIEEPHLIIGASCAYSWMPTILHFKSNQFDEAVAILNRARTSTLLTDEELWCLVYLINNSMVGVSKLLHFVNPQQYAIWDRRVDAYLRGAPYWTDGYLAYLALCREVVDDPAFAPVHEAINAKVGYEVTGLRAVELVMYTIGAGGSPGEDALV